MMEAISQFFVDWGYIGLFLSALVAGSILPFSSEAVLAVLVQMGADPVICLVSASVGNTWADCSAIGSGIWATCRPSNAG